MTTPSDKAMEAAEEIMVACWNGNPHLRDDSKTWLAGKFDAFAAQAVADERRLRGIERGLLMSWLHQPWCGAEPCQGGNCEVCLDFADLVEETRAALGGTP